MSVYLFLSAVTDVVRVGGCKGIVERNCESRDAYCSRCSACRQQPFFLGRLRLLFFIGVSIIAGSVVDFILHIRIDYCNRTIEADYQKGLVVPFITSIDIFLFAMVLYVFGIGTYELFINKLDSVNKYIYANPKWLSVSSIDDLKHHLGKVILMILVVYFFKFAIQIKYNEPMDLLFLALGILFMSGALFIANYHHKSK